ncbi:MAG: type VI secretion system baseplate subunit TssF [Pirellulaceae bacterium]|nr:type VI secretion system baseplate subunit TssF [Pirellulaceae bacterium]
MSDELLRYYNQELQYLRRQADEFGRANKELAAHLQLNSEGHDDPYVGRLVQAFAYLNARTRLKLDDEFPEIVSSLLDVIVPHYQRFIPSCSIVQFRLDKSQADQLKGYQVAAQANIETEPIDGEPCRFRSCYPVTCWPFQITDIALRGVPFEAPALVGQSEPHHGLLKIRLQTLDSEIPFSAFSCQSLRFYIHLPAPFCYQLYELLFQSVTGLAIARSPKDPAVQVLPLDALRAVGFAEDEGLIEYPTQSFLGYRLLTEYFAFREKFLFFDIQFDGALAGMQGASLELYLYLNRRWKDLEGYIDQTSLQLGCTPIVNLFPKQAEPIRLSHTSATYRVDPDARRRQAFEVYSIQSVRGRSNSGTIRVFEPFYSLDHANDDSARPAYWHGTRSQSEGDELTRGTDVDIAFVDPEFNPLKAIDWTIEIDTLCSNRNLPARMPFGGDHPRLFLEGAGAIERVQCLLKPTSPQRPAFPAGLRWRVVSHLSLNYLSLVDSRSDSSSAAALRELLTLYDFGVDPVGSNSIAGLRQVHSRACIGRLPGDYSGAICRGREVTIEFDEDKYTSGNLFLFASVLEHFLTAYCSINSFVRLVAVSNRRQGNVHQWPARGGTQHVL